MQKKNNKKNDADQKFSKKYEMVGSVPNSQMVDIVRLLQKKNCKMMLQYMI